MDFWWWRRRQRKREHQKVMGDLAVREREIIVMQRRLTRLQAEVDLYRGGAS